MDVTSMLILVFAVMLIALIATIMVGKSQANQDENSQYMQRTGAKWLRIGLLYVATIIVIVLIFIALK
jgi:heme/copper-type cytochrome/quinol oxidase subunit 2